ncbi:hypothetical protein DXG01_008871 [Tephrocybe rancida]|nr:hypothetical protein DXG01_008871 [Tephrocybe rancida]
MMPFKLALIAFLIPYALAAPAGNDPILVNLRVEGDMSTIFERTISTRGHDVTPISGDKHVCDGTNNHKHPTPGPTATAALDDASKIGSFSWNGTWYWGFEDYLVTRIASVPKVIEKNVYWHIILNYKDAPFGGCQQRVEKLDEVLYAYSASNKTLKLAGPHEARVGIPITLLVTDGETGKPVSGASVGGGTSDINGHVVLTFSSSGEKRLKAEKPSTIRSKVLAVEVSIR